MAGLGNVPWITAGDWNVTPDELWLPALAPRTSGWLPDVGSRRPTCFPVKGEPTEKDFFLVSHCLKAAVADYEFCPSASCQRIGLSGLPSAWERSGNRSSPSKSPGPSRTLSPARVHPRGPVATRTPPCTGRPIGRPG